jgi:hypothetical protein
MTRRVLLILTLSLFAGCAARQPVTTLVHEAFTTGRVGDRPPNLVLGPTREIARVGQWYTFREEWPAVPFGWRLEEVSTYTDATFDDQAYYDRFGGAFFKVQDSVRTGIILR